MSERARGSCSDVWALRVAINRGFELVARRPTGYAVLMELARQRDLDGSKWRSVSELSLVLS